VEIGNHRLQKFNKDGRSLAIFPPTPRIAKLNSPSGVAVDPAGNIYIADTLNHRILLLGAY
jgi:DNA-binding beta-propeller fold protein YncE